MAMFKILILTYVAAVLFISKQSYAGSIDGYESQINQCAQDNQSSSSFQNGMGTSVNKDPALKACINKVIRQIQLDKKTNGCDKLADADSAKREKCSDLEQVLQNAYSTAGFDPSSIDVGGLGKQCQSEYDENSDLIKQCKSMDVAQAQKCLEPSSTEMDFMNTDQAASMGPLVGMVSGADTLLGVYTAMNDRPGCYLSKSDFRDNEKSLTDQKKEIEDAVKDNAEKAETAQSEFADKLKEWADQEKEISDRLADIPNEREEKLTDFDKQKADAKIQADGEKVKIVDQIAELRRKYNDMINQKAVTMAENDDFSIHDLCAAKAVGQDPTKKGQESNSPATMNKVNNSFSGAFMRGKVLTGNIQKRYDSCINVEKKKRTRIDAAYSADMGAIKGKIQSLESMLGQLEASAKVNEEYMNKKIEQYTKSLDAEVKKLALKYQQIQKDKATQQGLLQQKLKRLQEDNMKKQRELMVVKMKLQHYEGKKPPKNSDKAMLEMADECGASYTDFVEFFKKNCCDNRAYQGGGQFLCKYDLKDSGRLVKPRTDDSKKKKEAGRSK